MRLLVFSCVATLLSGCATHTIERDRLDAADYRHLAHLSQPYLHCMAWHGQRAAAERWDRSVLESDIHLLCREQRDGVIDYMVTTGAEYAAQGYDEHLLSTGAITAIDEFLRGGRPSKHPLDRPLVAAWPTYTVEEVAHYSRIESAKKAASNQGPVLFSLDEESGVKVESNDDFKRLTEADNRDVLPPARAIDANAPPVDSIAQHSIHEGKDNDHRRIGPRTKRGGQVRAYESTCSC